MHLQWEFGQDRRLPLPTGCRQGGPRNKGGPPRIATAPHARELQPRQGLVKDGENAEEKLINETIKKNNLKLLNIYEQRKNQVKAWIKTAEKVQTADSSAGKKGGGLWAARDAKNKELKAENKRLKAKVKELKGSGGTVSTSTVGAHHEAADSVQLEEDGKKWRGEFDLTLARDDLQRRLKDAEEDKARAQRSHDKELAHATELSDQKVKVADLAGYARAIGEANRPRGSFNTPSPKFNDQDDGSLKYLMGAMPSQ